MVEFNELVPVDLFVNRTVRTQHTVCSSSDSPVPEAFTESASSTTFGIRSFSDKHESSADF
ncbi:unnamed protein product [Heligmosomoides polygyrus]|uniref:Uncharacterized protein n=1 Tax=Heligmosomoides polygyrus TaxID=6339 RepID=A0A183FFP4_HELPZ|nr:unnamed protein product [Heligmosomoides polygyrus]